MKTKIGLFILTLCLFAGCAPITLIDHVSSGTPKGYVEFYLPKGGAAISRSSIYLIVNGKDIYEGATSNWDVGVPKTGLRIAKSPGDYLFAVRVGGHRKKVLVQIIEGMVTPVRIVYTDVGKSSSFVPGGYMTPGGVQTTTSFNMEVYPEKPVPIAEYDK
jgi:hypothetical protein